jgi:hypothetical protein
MEEQLSEWICERRIYRGLLAVCIGLFLFVVFGLMPSEEHNIQPIVGYLAATSAFLSFLCITMLIYLWARISHAESQLEIAH